MPSWNGREYAKRLAYQARGLAVQLVAWGAGEPVGRGMLVRPGHPEWSVSAWREACPELRDVEVADAWRGRGIGTALVEALVEEARGVGADRVGLMVGIEETFGTAQRLYERLGFTQAHGPFVTSTRLEGEEGSWFAVAGVCVYLVKSLGNDRSGRPSQPP